MNLRRSLVQRTPIGLRRTIYAWRNRPRSGAVRLFRQNGHGVLITSIPKSGTHLLTRLMVAIGLYLPHEPLCVKMDWTTLLKQLV